MHGKVSASHPEEESLGQDDASGEAVAPAEAALLEGVREVLLLKRNLDISSYNRRYVLRRLAVRQRALGLKGMADYLPLLTAGGEEIALCLDALTVNVTAFFRDRGVWEFLRRSVFPEIANRLERTGGRRMRILSAGCATGEETWALSLLADEALEGRPGLRWEVLGLDLDENALARAREANYEEARILSVPPPMRPRLFEAGAATPGMLQIRKRLRQGVRFFRHDLLQPLPEGNFDLILCRNVLMYFSQPLQGKILGYLDSGLCPDGWLVLGQVERPAGSAAAAYETVSLENRVLRKSHSGR